MGPVSREAELLVLIARPVLDASSPARIRALIQSGLDWDLLHRIGSRHRLGPFLYTHLNAVAAADIPRPVFMDLWRTQARNARRAAALVEELARVLRLLEHHGVPVVAYKGPVLALQLYGDAAMREYEDLDVLVPVNSMPRVAAALAADQYDPEDRLDERSAAALYRMRLQYHRVFVHRGSGEKLEVHWRTDPVFPVEDAANPGWWQSRPVVDVGGAAARSFSAGELLAILCLHGSKHQGHRLGWMVEIAQLLRQHEIDWPWLTALTRSLGCRRRVLVSLMLAQTWADAALPADVLREIQEDADIRSAVEQVSARLFTSDIDERQGLDRLRMDLLVCDRWSQRAALVTGVVLAPTKADWSRHALPRSMGLLYVPLRLLRLAVKYGVPRR